MFGRKTASPWFYDTSVHIEAMNRLLYQLDNGAGLSLVYGPDGSGRTSLLRQLQHELRRQQCASILMSAAALDTDSLLRQIADALNILCPEQLPPSAVLLRLRDELRGRSHCGLRTVILLDDLHLSTRDVSSAVHYLAGLAEQNAHRISVIGTCPLSGVPGLSQVSTLRIMLAALSLEESREFVRERLRQAPGGARVIESTAITAIAELAGGLPVRLTQFCRLLQLVQEAAPEIRIDEEVVREIAREVAPRAVA